MAGYSTRNNLNSYLANFNEACVNDKDGVKVSKLLSLFELETSRVGHMILSEFDEATICRFTVAPWDDIIISHLKCCIAYTKDGRPVEAFNYKCSLLQALSKVLQQVKDENWLLPALFVSTIELRKLAKMADHAKRSQCDGSVQVKPDECLEEAASQIMVCFRICATDNRAAPEVSKRRAMINLINQLFKIYFKINKLHLCKPLIRALENAHLFSSCSLAQRVTYCYFTGMKALFDSDFRLAEQQLSFAFLNCHPQSFKNQRLILIFLIPVKMLLGFMPKLYLLKRYDLMEFEPILRAVKEGNLRLMDQTLEEYADFFWNFGIYLILEKLKIIAYRNIFKKVGLIVKTHQIPIDFFTAALRYLENENMTTEEVHCILANLIFEGKIKGYISLQHQKLVISKQNPFPSLSSIS